jgi:hypothetical protein
MPNLQPLVDAIAQRGDIVIIVLTLLVLIGAGLFAATLRLLSKIAFSLIATLQASTKAQTELRSVVDANTQATHGTNVALASVAQQMAVQATEMKMLRERRR